MTIWQRWKQTALHNKAMVLSSVLMAFGTLFYTGAALVQLWMFDRNSKETSQQTEKLIEAANINAGAAASFAVSANHAVTQLQQQSSRMDASRLSSEAASEKALQTTVDNSHRDQRAWVVPLQANIEPAMDGKRSFFNVIYKNAGKTPALHSQTSIASGADLSQLPAVDQYVAEGSQVMVIAPDGIENASTSAVDGSVLTSIHGGLRFYIYGTIWYDDIFGKHHWTQFCFIPHPNLKAFAVCSIHNMTDEEKIRVRSGMSLPH